MSIHILGTIGIVVLLLPFGAKILVTACAVAKSCCISDEPCQWEMANFDPHSSEIS